MTAIKPAMASRTPAWRVSLVTLTLGLTLQPSEARRGRPIRQQPAPPTDWKLDALQRLAPDGFPKCFGNRQTWDDYLSHAAADTRHAHVDGPLIVSRSRVEFNPRFDYCSDCTRAREAQMLAAGRCDKTWLLRAAKG